MPTRPELSSASPLHSSVHMVLSGGYQVVNVSDWDAGGGEYDALAGLIQVVLTNSFPVSQDHFRALGVAGALA